jgi:hypothetical protein
MPGRTYHNYETVSVTILPPGWRHVYVTDGDPGLFFSPCPAVLVQELRSTELWPDDGRAEQLTPLLPPFSTRVRFAEQDGADLIAIDEDLSGNYAGTIGPTADAEDVTALVTQWRRSREAEARLKAVR